jgi:hypothetical protein
MLFAKQPASKGTSVGAKRRIDVMLSSTFWDLEDKREEVLRLMRRHDLHDIAMENDAALPTMDKIDSSLSKVNRAAAYICIIGFRYGTREYCEQRNPDNLSLTELEFRRAQKRDIPRCTLIMSGRYRGIPLSEYEAVSAEDKTSLAAFRKLAESDRVYASFDDNADFTVKAMQSLDQLRADLDARERAEMAAVATATTLSEPPPSPDDRLPAVHPAFHYVRKPYVERYGFAGRTKELALIDQWATGADAMLLFQAIGGMGKTMLTWHWLRTRATAARNDWAGRLWYSFYEQGADLNDFCIHALAYVRHEPPKTFRGRRTLELGDELRRELDARPWLLILDGLERVLVAYNRAGKEHMTDEEAVVDRDGMGFDREPRDCFRPEDDDVLAMLAQAGRGKLLASSRLTPAALTNTARQPIPGVMCVALEGLAPDDAEQVLHNAGVRGDGWRMRRFLDDNFACHPLSVGVVAGQIMTFLEARGDFDRWVEHPKGGADPALITKDLRGRQNHILARAFDDLDAEAKALLGSIAMASIELTMDVLRILNPKRPIKPRFYFDFDQTLAKQQETYDAYVAAYPVWLQKADEADAWLTQALPDLEARGLVQYDADTASLDMHPAIRHTTLIALSPEARGRTGSHVSDALSSRPLKPLAEARTRDDLAVAMTRVEALNAAGKLKEGWDLLQNSGLHDGLVFLQYVHEQLELMQPYFPKGWVQGPVFLPEDAQPRALHRAAIALRQSGKPELSTALYINAVKLGLKKGEVTAAILSNFGISLAHQGQCARAERLESLAIRCAESNDDQYTLRWLRANQVSHAANSGRLHDAESILVALREVITNEEVDAALEGHILKSDLELAFRMRRLSEPIVEQCLKRIRLLRDRFSELQILHTIASWHQANGKHQAALDVFGDLIALANDIGSPYLPGYEAHRALSLAAFGRQEEVRRIANKVDHGKHPPHISLALLYLALADRDKARSHALAGYTKAWGEGPPYHDHWDLEDCRKVLATVGEPEPVLPPFDPSKVEPFDFEPDVERLIEKKLAEKSTAKLSTKRSP